MTKNNNYYEMLFAQFKQANGMKESERLRKHEKEFQQWLIIQRGLLAKYAAKLNLLGLIDEYGFVVELGKGSLDTVTEDLLKYHDRVLAMTPFDNTFTNPNVETVNSRINVPQNLNNVGTFITQLPVITKEDYLKFMTTFCNVRPIVIGAYGKDSDKDKFSKFIRLKGLRQQILDNFGQAVETKETHINDEDEYFHIISAKQKVRG